MATELPENPIEGELNDILEQYPAYKKLTLDQAKYLYEKFVNHSMDVFSSHLATKYPDGARLCYHGEDIHTLVEQVWKRKIYFSVFHEGVDGMNELKESALYCFWILKLQPFYLYGFDSMSTNKLNAWMALRILIAGALTYTQHMNERIAEKAKEENRVVAPLWVVNDEKNIIEDLFYSFQFRDWSKEAIMDLCAGLIFTSKAIVQPLRTA